MNPRLLPQPRPRTWKARWIWPAAMPADASNVYAHFRKTFTLWRTPGRLTLFISADRLYQVPGTVPSPADFVAGDRFAPRSAYLGIGLDEKPTMRHIDGTEHSYAATDALLREMEGEQT